MYVGEQEEEKGFFPRKIKFVYHREGKEAEPAFRESSKFLRRGEGAAPKSIPGREQEFGNMEQRAEMEASLFVISS